VEAAESGDGVDLNDDLEIDLQSPADQSSTSAATDFRRVEPQALPEEASSSGWQSSSAVVPEDDDEPQRRWTRKYNNPRWY